MTEPTTSRPGLAGQLNTMDAITHDRYGSPDVLNLETADVPSIGSDEVLIRVKAAGLNRGDGLAVEGIPYAARLSYGMTKPKQHIPGTDVAGVVEAVGSAVSEFQPGTEVFGWSSGAFAEFSAASADMLSVKPERLTFEQAAAAPSAGVAALQGLRDAGRIEAGHEVLVVGASGGLGGFAVQIAKAYGAEVTGVCGTSGVQLVRSAGADHVIDYMQEDFAAQGRRYDLILDMVGKHSLTSARRAVKDGGTYVVVAGGNPRSLTGMGRFARAMLASPLGRQQLRPLFSKKDAADLAHLSELLEDGAVSPLIDSVRDLIDTPEAFRYLNAGHARGKVVIAVS